MSVLENDNTVKILVINPTDKEVIIPKQKKLANISLLTSSVKAIGIAPEEKREEPEPRTQTPGTNKAVTVGNDGWLATKTRSNTDTEAKKEEDRAFRQQLLERIDADLDKEKKAQMLELLWQYQDVFKAPEGIPTTTPLITHAIQSGDKVAYVKPYRMSPAQLQKAEEITGDY